MKTAMVAISTVTAPTRTGLAASEPVTRRAVMGRAGSRGVVCVRRRAAAAGLALGRVGGGYSGLVRAEPLAAAIEGMVVGLAAGAVFAAVVDDSDEFQHVPDLVGGVERQGLPEEVVPDRLHAGEAARAVLGGGLVGRGRGAGRGAAVGLDGPASIVDRLEELAQRLGYRRRVAGEPPQLCHLPGALLERLGPELGRGAE